MVSQKASTSDKKKSGEKTPTQLVSLPLTTQLGKERGKKKKSCQATSGECGRGGESVDHDAKKVTAVANLYGRPRASFSGAGWVVGQIAKPSGKPKNRGLEKRGR